MKEAGQSDTGAGFFLGVSYFVFPCQFVPAMIHFHSFIHSSVQDAVFVASESVVK